MGAPVGSFALIGEGRTKSSSDHIRKERTGTARETAPGDRRVFSCNLTPVVSPIDQNRQRSWSFEKKKKKKKSKRDPQLTQGRDEASWKTHFADYCLWFEGTR